LTIVLPVTPAPVGAAMTVKLVGSGYVALKLSVAWIRVR
jgi:hypothetical protein